MSTKPIESNIHSTASGSYKVRWRDRGRNGQKTFARKVDALKFQSDLLKRNDGELIETKKVRFDEFAQIWLERHCKLNVEEGTAIGYKQVLDKIILPFFGNMYLKDIDEDDV